MPGICTIEGCGREHCASGFCRKHYGRYYRGAVDPAVGKLGTVEQRFWRKITKGTPDQCWVFNGQSRKYAQVWLADIKKPVGAHCYSYTLHKGPIPNGMFVLHKCDNPRCVNPNHLFLGTPQDNMDDKVAKGRAKTRGCRGEESYKAILTEAKVRYIKRHPEMSHVALGEKFNVVPNTIRAIRIGKSWAHVK